MTRKCSLVMTLLFPVTVTKTSPNSAAFAMGITSYPSMAASMAFTGLISVTMTLAPSPLALTASPLPHQP